MRCRALRIRDNHRRGSVLVLILAVSMILTVIGMSALALNRVQRRTTTVSHSFTTAQSLAVSAMEHALQYLNTDAQAAIDGGNNWRDSYTHNVEHFSFPLGQGTCSWRLRDDLDHDIGDDASENFWVYATGTYNEISFTLKLEMQPIVNWQAMSCLDVAMMSEKFFSVYDSSLRTNQIVATNDRFFATAANVHSDVEAVISTTGTTYHKSNTSGVAARTIPSDDDLMFYVKEAVAINAGDLATDGDAIVLEDMVLSPATNPYGAGTTDADGVYKIHCGGSDITIRDCRIVGTLVLVKAATCTIEGSVNWEPAVAEYPALLTAGNITIDIVDNDLAEPSAISFNPPGTPYNGSADSDDDDLYPSSISGIVMATGKIWFDLSGSVKLSGCYIARDSLVVRTGAVVNLTRPSDLAVTPPPGFRTAVETAPPYPVSSSWEQVISD